MDSGQGHLRPVRRGRRWTSRTRRSTRPRWGWVVLAAVVVAVTLLVVGSTTGQCVDAVTPEASICTTSPSGPARLALGLAGTAAVVVLLRRAVRRR